MFWQKWITASCPLGKQLVGGTCEECPVGFYKDVVGSDSGCTECPTGFITSGTGAESQGSCSLGEQKQNNLGIVAYLSGWN